jgi:hypothetical protein
MGAMFINHFLLDMALVSGLAGGGRILLGVAVLLAVGSSRFWIIFAVAAALNLIALILLWLRQTKRSSRFAALLIVSIATVLYFLLFLASFEVFAWFSKDISILLYAILDVLTVVVVGLILLTEWYTREYGVPTFPRLIYDAYGLGHYWLHIMSDELHALWPGTMLMSNANHEMASKHHGHIQQQQLMSQKQVPSAMTIYSQCAVCGAVEDVKPDKSEKDSESVVSTGSGEESASDTA